MDINSNKKRENYHINLKIVNNKHFLYSIFLIIILLISYNFVQIYQLEKYTNDEVNKIRGLSNQSLPSINLVIIENENCKECIDMSIAVSEFKNLNIKFNDEKKYSFAEADKLINKYKIEKIPALILSPEASKYKVITDIWDKVGTVENDGYFVLRNINPPYLDLKTNEIKGIVNLIMLYDENCKECYDVTKHKLAIAKIKMYIKNEEKIDINSKEGKELIQKYKITKIPTILLSKEAMDYPQFDFIWSSVGDTADDGTLVFRNVETMGTYKDLKTNKIIKV
ncbi:hypothetical protein J4455_02365 [Candidatus Woesearchaeota archaeon]|nr:hypothetical protein [Candidatus Woesearchaeota archaeon]